MPNKKSAKKELRKNVKRNIANKKIVNKFKDLTKTNLKQIKTDDKKVKEDFTKTIKAIDKAAKRGLIKKNNASRRKSKLMTKINNIK